MNEGSWGLYCLYRCKTYDVLFLIGYLTTNLLQFLVTLSLPWWDIAFDSSIIQSIEYRWWWSGMKRPSLSFVGARKFGELVMSRFVRALKFIYRWQTSPYLHGAYFILLFNYKHWLEIGQPIGKAPSYLLIVTQRKWNLCSLYLYASF